MLGMNRNYGKPKAKDSFEYGLGDVRYPTPFEELSGAVKGATFILTFATV